MPAALTNDFLSKLYLSETLIIANLLGALGTLFLIFSMINLLSHIRDKTKLYFICQFTFLSGIISYFAVQFGETFVWPVLAKSNPDLLHLNGPLIKPGTLFFTANVTAGLLATVGIILFSIILVRQLKSSKILSVIYAISFIVFMVGIDPFIRTVGFALWIPVQLIIFHGLTRHLDEA
ncbi:MAG: hypothetical protein OEZ36_04580 [Spirochaetota bacterium]|nr:hypothetical protein [Spirochaetota bacterium]